MREYRIELAGQVADGAIPTLFDCESIPLYLIMLASCNVGSTSQ